MAAVKDLNELESHLRMEDGPRAFWYANDAYHISNYFHALMEKSRELIAERARVAR